MLLRVIAAFKFLKAALLVAVSVGAFRLLHQDVAGVFEHWIVASGLDPGNRYLDALLARMSNLTPDQIKKLGIGSLLYAALFLVEGTGLWMRKRWGEWLTVIITGSLLPLEIYEIIRHLTTVRVFVLIVNVGIVWYLVHHIRNKRASSK
jgi:uncharacterized membrane protein (DUF2068 family)